ncbi:MAG: protein kinase [Candidatus Wallbacteria bacterium]|nr:protein kinase [Candidatus Wallbacteria bacterium]
MNGRNAALPIALLAAVCWPTWAQSPDSMPPAPATTPSAKVQGPSGAKRARKEHRYAITVELATGERTFTARSWMSEDDFKNVVSDPKKVCEPYIIKAKRKMAESQGYTKARYGTDNWKMLTDPDVLWVSIVDAVTHRSQKFQAWSRGARLGKYVLQKKLGQGGMGVVFLAVQEGLNRPVALKVLPEKNATRNDNLIRRFKKEISVCARLSHPNIVKVFDAGFEDGNWYYAMELLEATTLEDRLKDDQRLPVAEALPIARDLCEAFRYYFPLGIVHRDLKPGNIMTDASGKTVVTDFGLVKDLLATGITRTGVSLGTPYYMSPEMVLARTVGPSSDIYQFGVILYRMLTGQLPFHATHTAEVLKKILTTTPDLPSKLNPEIWPSLDTLIMNCLVKAADRRYQDAEVLARDLALATRRGRIADLSVASPQASGPSEPAAAAGNEGDRFDPAAEPATPSSSREAVPRARAQRRPPEPQKDSVPTQTLQGVTPATSSRHRQARVLAAAGALVLLVTSAVVLRLHSTEFGATEVSAAPGMRQAVVTWASLAAYRDRIEFSADAEAPKVVAGEDPASSRHRLLLSGLSPGRTYRFQILYPDGKRSLEHSFQTVAAAIDFTRLEPQGPGWQLVFETPAAARLTLHADGKEESEQTPATTHRVSLPDFDPEKPALALGLRFASGESLELTGPDLVERLRESLLPRLATELARSLASLDPEKFVKERIDPRLPANIVGSQKRYVDGDGLDELWTPAGFRYTGHVRKYDPFASGDATAQSMAEEMRQWLTGVPVRGELAAFLKLGRGFFDSRHGMTQEALLALYEGIWKCRDMEHYAAVLRIPFRMGAEELFQQNYRVRYSPLLPSAAVRH